MFDLLNATSAGFNDRPEAASRPFDRDRDGLVCGEGAGVLVLEAYGHAAARGARMYAEVKGFALSASGVHVSQSNNAGMIRCIRGALADAGVRAEEVGYINAHATGTPQGDGEEAGALRALFGGDTPVSSLKGYLGHTLGASGALELAVTLRMMEKGVLYPTRNLEHVADDCAGLHHLTVAEERRVDVALKNSFGFGGVNCALVLARV
jgi:3-oxoacyl-[acyl-carrier-protein] synthase II